MNCNIFTITEIKQNDQQYSIPYKNPICSPTEIVKRILFAGAAGQALTSSNMGVATSVIVCNSPLIFSCWYRLLCQGRAFLYANHEQVAGVEISLFSFLNRTYVAPLWDLCLNMSYIFPCATIKFNIIIVTSLVRISKFVSPYQIHFFEWDLDLVFFIHNK